MALDPEKLFAKDDPTKLYKLLEELAVGSYGRVYRAQDKKTNQICALKVIPLEENDALDVRIYPLSHFFNVTQFLFAGFPSRNFNHENHLSSKPCKILWRMDEEKRVICTLFHDSRV